MGPRVFHSINSYFFSLDSMPVSLLGHEKRASEEKARLEKSLREESTRFSSLRA